MTVRLLEKTERRLGQKLGLKPERCSGPKCAAVRRAYAPGAHGKKRRRGASEYGELLREKQKVRFLYGLNDTEMRSYITKAAARQGFFTTNLLRLLESRLDNAVFRFGFAASRRAARHAVKYGHIAVNGKKVTIPSYQVKKGESVGIWGKSQKSTLFTNLDIRFKKYEPPHWLTLDKTAKVGTVAGVFEPAGGEALAADFIKVKEFYSR